MAGSARSASASPAWTSAQSQLLIWRARLAASSPLSSSARRWRSTACQIASMPSSCSAEQASTSGVHAGRRRPQQLQRRAVVGLRALRRGEQLAVGLVDHHEVGELDDAALDALQLVAGARREQQQKAVDHVGDRALALADADRLDHDHVEAGRLAGERGLARAPRDPAERATGGRGADERFGRLGEPLHARLVAQNRAAAAPAGRDRPRAPRSGGPARSHGGRAPR